MTINELRLNLKHLVDVYVLDPALKGRLLSLVARQNIPVKEILAELEPSLIGKLSQADSKIIKEISFYFC